MARVWLLLTAALFLFINVDARKQYKREDMEVFADSADESELDEEFDEVESCQCGVFMSSQVGIKDGRRFRSRGPPEGEPVVHYDTDSPTLPCGTGGLKHCIGKCLDVILKYLPRAGPVICGAVERDINREKAFLYIKNCGGDWTSTNFSAGKEFCCTNGEHHKC